MADAGVPVLHDRRVVSVAGGAVDDHKTLADAPGRRIHGCVVPCIGAGQRDYRRDCWTDDGETWIWAGISGNCRRAGCLGRAAAWFDAGAEAAYARYQVT